MLLRYPDPGIFHRYPDVVTLFQRQGGFCPYRHIFTPDRNDPSLRHGMEGIDDEVVDDLSDLPFVRLNRLDLLRDYKVASDVLASSASERCLYALSEGFKNCVAMDIFPRMAVRMLLKSWAIPPANTPRDSSLWVFNLSSSISLAIVLSSALLRSVMSLMN